MWNRRRTVWVAAVVCGFVVFLTAGGRLGADSVAANIAVLQEKTSQTLTGDISRGRTLVESRGCFDCHRIVDRGSRMGPDLSDIGSKRTPDRLRQALIAPDEEVLMEHRFVRIVTKDGVTVTGKLLNQDAISVQLITQKDELKTYLRANVREYTILDKGLMPSVEGKLTPEQVTDIVAYLSSLKAT